MPLELMSPGERGEISEVKHCGGCGGGCHGHQHNHERGGPCMIVGVAMRQEFGTWKWVVVAFTYQTVLAWTVAMIIYQGGMLLGLGG